MPPKKPPVQPPAQGGGAAFSMGPFLTDGTDPVIAAVNIIDKKTRNLEKRKNKLAVLRESMEQGTKLDKDQMEAITKIEEVNFQLILTRELQKQFNALNAEYQKARKKQQRVEKQQQKDAEREAQRRAVAYTLRIQDILNCMDEEAKESFRTGSSGAVLSESELTQLDELYSLLAPQRADNPSYQSQLEIAGEHFLLLMEQSPREVEGTTYKELYEILKRIDQSCYFDKPAQEEEEEEEDLDSEEGAEESADGHVASADEGEVPVDEGYNEEPEEVTAEEQHHEIPLGGESIEYLPPQAVPLVTTPPAMAPTAVIAQQVIGSYMPSAPSPTFPGLGPNPLQPPSDEGFSFMHDSEVDRTQPMQQSQNAPLTTTASTQLPIPTQPQTIDYSAYPSATTQGGSQNLQHLTIVTPQGGVGSVPEHSHSDTSTTDVATGQPSPSVDPQYQSKSLELVSDQPLLPSPSYPGVGVRQEHSVGSFQSQSSSYGQQRAGMGSVPPLGNYPNNRGGRGQGRRGGGGGGGGGPRMYQNGRGGPQGYGGYGGPQGGARGYGVPRGGGGGVGGGGRPNYRTGGPRK